MQYRNVGKSGLKISEVALGSWVTDLKGTAAEDVAKQTVKLAYESGVNFFDCADAYSARPSSSIRARSWSSPARSSSAPAPA